MNNYVYKIDKITFEFLHIILIKLPDEFLKKQVIRTFIYILLAIKRALYR